MAGSQRSFAKGRAPPGPVPEGVVRLYGMRFCPYVQRASLVMVAKGIKHEIVNINLRSKPDWFFEKNPKGLVPTIETSDGKIIYESLIVCDYLDDAFPGKKLTPADPYEKAQQKILLEHFSEVPSILFNVIMTKKKNEDTTELKAKFLEKLKIFEETLVKRNSPYIGGGSLTMIDYMIWPWFERFQMDVTEVLEKMPHINAWYKRMLKDPAVKKTFTEPEVFNGFLQIYDSLDAADYGLD
ncbi:glutathione S-transferase omega-1-like [Ranitomeya variabilis]|uniref:glutathione S-transferase omega-1-like n=1 Tax=Ranitomeya variabilis TaxID=490064 RepID=UPI00405747A8